MQQDQQHQYRSMNTSQNRHRARPPMSTDENQPRDGPSMIIGQNQQNQPPAQSILQEHQPNLSCHNDNSNKIADKKCQNRH